MLLFVHEQQSLYPIANVLRCFRKGALEHQFGGTTPDFDVRLPFLSHVCCAGTPQVPVSDLA
jgi:hypothetical protein